MDRDLPVEPGDETLVVMARNGDRGAFEQLVERHQQKAYRIAFDFSRDREEAKDLSQEAFLRAFTHLKAFDGRSSFYTWFYRILVNVCLDHRRRSRRTAAEPYDENAESAPERIVQDSDLSGLDRNVIAGQIFHRVGAALDRLPAKQRTAFILKNHQGLSIREIAGMMKSAEGTVKVHLHRAVKALRQALAELV